VIEDAAVIISKLGHRAKRRFQALLEPTGLRANQAQVISYVREHPGASQRELVDALHVTPSMVVELVDHLERDGYVVRERRPADRRSWAVRLTPAGDQVWEQVRQISARVEDELLTPLAPSDRDRLLGYLRELDGSFVGR
jgi:DNA-binding MarR family transcriptional regulator